MEFVLPIRAAHMLTVTASVCDIKNVEDNKAEKKGNSETLTKMKICFPLSRRWMAQSLRFLI